MTIIACKLRIPLFLLNNRLRTKKPVFYACGNILTCILLLDFSMSVLRNLSGAACNFIKKETLHKCFTVNFAKFLRTPFLQNTSGRLLLKGQLTASLGCEKQKLKTKSVFRKGVMLRENLVNWEKITVITLSA